MEDSPNVRSGKSGNVLAALWRRQNDWFKAFLLGAGVLLIAHFFVLRWVTVRSASMFSTLLPGDLVAVARWPIRTGFHQGDVVVFHDPLQNDRSMMRRTLEVKRIVGLPGDEIRLRDGHLSVNGQVIKDQPGITHSWLLRCKSSVPTDSVLDILGLPASGGLPGGSQLELPLNEALMDGLHQKDLVRSGEPLSTLSGASRHIFPYSPNFPWNADDYGPISLPAQGDTLRIDASTLPLYDRLITHYECNQLEVKGNEVRINGVETHTYIVKQDYYFVLGDSRHYSEDSRYWGFVPADHLVGRASFVLLSNRPGDGAVRSDRWFRSIE